MPACLSLSPSLLSIHMPVCLPLYLPNFSPSICLSACLSISLTSLHPYACLPASLSPSLLSIHMPACLSLSISLTSLHPYACLSISLTSLHPYACLPLYLPHFSPSICLSAPLSLSLTLCSRMWALHGSLHKIPLVYRCISELQFPSLPWQPEWSIKLVFSDSWPLWGLVTYLALSPGRVNINQEKKKPASCL